MRMPVDKTGADAQAGDIENLFGFLPVEIADGGDDAVLYADIGLKAGLAGAVDDGAVFS